MRPSLTDGAPGGLLAISNRSHAFGIIAVQFGKSRTARPAVTPYLGILSPDF